MCKIVLTDCSSSPSSSSSSSSEVVVEERMKATMDMNRHRLEVDSRSVYVGNLAFSTSTTDVRNHLKPCGIVVHVFIPRHPSTMRMIRNFAFVEFASVDSAQKALRFHSSTLLNRPIVVTPKRTKLADPSAVPARRLGLLEVRFLPIVHKKRPFWPEEQKDLKSVYVGNVDWFATRDELKEHFSSCGHIVQVTIPKDVYTKKQMTYAFIQFECIQSVHKALLLHCSLFRNRPIVVHRKHQKTTEKTTENNDYFFFF